MKNIKWIKQNPGVYELNIDDLTIEEKQDFLQKTGIPFKLYTVKKSTKPSGGALYLSVINKKERKAILVLTKFNLTVKNTLEILSDYKNKMQYI